MKKFYITLLLSSLSFVAMATEPEGVAELQDGLEATVEEAADSVAVAAVELTPNEARKLRGFSADTNFVPRGQWVFGGTASYSTHRNTDYKLLIVDNINSEGYTVNVSPMIAYAPWRNMTVGIRFGYGRSLLAIDSATLAIGEGESGVNVSLGYTHQIKHSYTGSLFWRPYIPLGRNNRFAIFAEVQLNMTGSQGKLVTEDEIIDKYQSYNGKYTESLGGSIALQPGIVAFVTNNTALELSIGVFGVGFERTKQLRNQVEEGVVKSSNMNFKVNLLSIGFGVSFYL